MKPVGIAALSVSCAAGHGLDALAQARLQQRSALQPNRLGTPPLAGTFSGCIAALDDAALPSAWRAWDCRATRLVALGLEADGFLQAVAAARRRWGAARVGLVLGTSASTIGASEQAYRELDADGAFPPALRSAALNTPHALAAFAQQLLALEGPCQTVSTACSSGAKAYAAAERWLRLGLADAVVAGGADALGNSLLYGFRALGLLSDAPCRPFDAARRGISLGEAASFALLTRDDAAVQLTGYGESNDAFHMSSPHPQGLGAERALDDALARAGLRAEDIDCVNLHGTASTLNDAAEAALVVRRYRADVHASATKGLTGHTMGAAGALEAAICVLALQRGVLAGSAGTEQPDPAFGAAFAARLRLQPAQAQPRTAANHSFGFGGNNCVLVFGQPGAHSR